MKLWTGNMPYYNSAVDFRPYLKSYVIEGARLGIVV